MSYFSIIRVLSSIIILIGTIVIFGWVLDIPILKSLSPDWVTMKFSTAISFLMSGIILLFMNESRYKNNELARIAIFVPLIIILFFMLTFLVSVIIGTEIGTSELFVKEELSAIHSVTSGTPSIGTMINFLLIVSVGFAFLLTPVNQKKIISVIGAVILFIAVFALIGYIIDSPPMYYELEEISGAMAIHTTIAFILIGFAMVLFASIEPEDKKIRKTKFPINISTKLVFFFLISAIIPIIMVGLIALDLAQTSLEKENFTKLNSISKLEIHEIEGIFGEIRTDTVVAQKYFNVRTNLPIVSEHYENSNRDKIPDYINAKQTLDGQLVGVLETSIIDDIILLDTNGVFIYHTSTASSEWFGKPFPFIDQTLLENAKTEQQFSRISLDESYKPQATIFSIVGIYDFDDELVGFYVLDLNMELIFELIQDETRLGETGETLLGISKGNFAVFINPLKYDPDASSNRQIPLDNEFGTPMTNAVQGKSGASLSVDYRGEPIIAVWHYIPSLDWGIVSKIDTAEAFTPIYQLEQDIAILAFVFIFGIGFFGITASREISKPLILLKNLAMNISKGNLDVQSSIQSTDEIGSLSTSFNIMAKSLKENKKIIDAHIKELKLVDKQKSEFSTMISHELKTPLSTIIGYSEMLKDPVMGEINKEQESAIDEIRKSSSSLEQLIENILTSQKLDQLKLTFNIENVSTKELLTQVYNRLLPIMSEKQIEFLISSEEDLFINIDKERMMEIFVNLVQNSVDFVPASGGRIEITCKSKNSDVLFSVIDNGIGMPKDKQKNLFTKYYQIDTSITRKHGGSGLGLVICKGIIEGFGGKIWIESEEGTGTIIYFTIPKESRIK